MSEKELAGRDISNVNHQIRETVKELIGVEPAHKKDTLAFTKSIDVEGNEADVPKRPRLMHGNSRVKAQKKRRTRVEREKSAKLRRARLKEKKKVASDRLRELKIKVEAGDPSHPDYDKRLAHATRMTPLQVTLPYIARNKWAIESFQEEMMEKGFEYDPATWKGWMPYETAKAVQQQWIKAKTRSEYEFFIKLFGIRFLPTRPDIVYKDVWEGWPDFLNTINLFAFRERKEDYIPFIEALTYARSLKLKNVKEWIALCKNRTIPSNIPMRPHKVYDEWVSIEHWLGTSTGADAVAGRVKIEHVWLLYTDGRNNAFWWAKLSVDQYEMFKQTPSIQVVRTYAFEGDVSDKVWDILDKESQVYESDPRERLISYPNKVFEIRNELDSILQWYTR